MTVAQLVLALKSFPQEMEVLVEVHPDENTSFFWDIVEIGKCKLSDTGEEIVGVFLEEEFEGDNDIMEINFSLN